MTDTPYMTPAIVKAKFPSLGAANSDQAITDQIAEFEETVEDYVGWAFVERTVTDEAHQIDFGTLKQSTTNNWWPGFVSLDHRKVTSITSVTIDGNTIDPSLYDIDVLGKFLLFAPQITSAIQGPQLGRVLVTYTHGLTADIPRRLIRAGCLYVLATLNSDASGTPREVLSQAFEGGTTRYSTPSKADKRPTGYLEVDRLINSCLDSSRLPQVG